MDYKVVIIACYPHYFSMVLVCGLQEAVRKNRMNLFSFIFNFWIFSSAHDSHIYGLMFISEVAVEPCYNVYSMMRIEKYVQ